MAKHLYKRLWRPPSPTIDADDFQQLLQKRRLAELRAAVLDGSWQQQDDSDADSSASSSSSSDESGGRRSTSVASPRTARRRQGGAAAAAAAGSGADSDEEGSEDARQREAEEREVLESIHASLLAQQAEEEAAVLAGKAALEVQAAETAQQMGELQARLEELRQSKHDLVQQLKLVRLGVGRAMH